MQRGSRGSWKLKRCLVSVDIGTPKMAFEQTKESTIPTGGDDATRLSAPSAGAAHVPSEAGGSGTLSDLLEKGDGSKQEPPKLPLFSLSKEKRTSTDNVAAPKPKRGRTEPPAEGSLGPKGNAGPPVDKPTLTLKPSTSEPLQRGLSRKSRRWPKSQSKAHCPGTKCSMTW
jgi:hypothetical protein